jgi:two-component system CheB/CheR fusion protein
MALRNKKGKGTKSAPLRKSQPKANVMTRPAGKVAAKTANANYAKGPSFIVGIGASAGGLEAFEQFFSNMPSDSGMAFVLIPHLDPLHKSIMPDLLKRYTDMSIHQAENGMRVKPNSVYIIPPNKDMSILQGCLHLLEPGKIHGIRHPIDFFFRTLAEDQREKAVVIILSGTGTEGTLGLRAVKGEGGLVIAQDPKTAKYDGMPSSAVATGLVDYVLPPEKISGQLMKYFRGATFLPAKRVPTETKRGDILQKIFIIIRSQTGHDFSLYKQNTVVRRIERRMAIHQIERLEDYVNYLRNNPHEVDELFKELLIRVTNFFRDSQSFDLIRKKVLSQLLKGHPADVPVRVWVPGCSTGEEAYSLAIIFHEYLQKNHEKHKVQIFATDIDGSAIEVARIGMYSETITVDVSPERLARYFIKKGNMYKIKDEIREMVVFALQNVIKDPPFSKLDMISCRNLLIYLGAELQKKVLPLFRYALNTDGILFLGSSETIGDRTDLFSSVDKKWKIFRARKLDPKGVAAMDLHPLAPPYPAGKVGAPALKKPGEISIGDLASQILLEMFTPPCVIVNDKGDILYFHGRTGKFLEPAPGKAMMNVIEMAREGLRQDLRTSIRRAATTKDSLTVEGLQVRSNGGFQNVNLTVSYIHKPEYLEGLLMVVFQPLPQAKGAKPAEHRIKASYRTDEKTAELEYELKSTKERLQTTIEELETSNEELKSANEELQSANEELQSTNEELETSKEELQSVNEELVTVNAELETKIDELTLVNNDMTNLLTSTQIATIFLDNNLRIKRFTPTMTRVINLIQSDVGRPIGDIVSKLEYPDLSEDATEVIRTLSTVEKVVLSRNGHWFLTRIMPYRTTSNVIDGVVITFIDITDQHRIKEETFRLAAICEATPDAIVGLKTDGSIANWNNGAEDLLGYAADEAEGKPFDALFPSDRSEEIADLVNAVKAGERPMVRETVVRTKNDATVAVSLILSPVRNGEIVSGYSAILRDILKGKEG